MSGIATLSPSVVLFMAAWGVGIVSWFLGIAEFVAMARFWPWAFGIGVRVWRETRPVPLPTGAVGTEIETSRGKVKLVDPGCCLFRRTMGLAGYDVRTPFPLKGAIRWNGDRATVEGRVPVFSTLFLAAWLVGWTVAGFMMARQTGPRTLATGILLLGWVVATGMILFSIPFEIRRARQVLAEYEAQLRR